MRFLSKFRETINETIDFKPDLVMARLNELSGDLVAAELYYRSAARLSCSPELKAELYDLADKCRINALAEVD